VRVVLQVVREATHGEIIKDKDGKDVELFNLRGDKFWAAPAGCDGPLILICADGLETECLNIKRGAIVSLIECGVAGS
jgi:hypothetical protein